MAACADSTVGDTLKPHEIEYQASHRDDCERPQELPT